MLIGARGRLVRNVTAVTVAALTMSLLGTFAPASAESCRPRCGPGEPDGPPALETSGSADAEKIQVGVDQQTTQPGSSQDAPVVSRTVWVAPVCSYARLASGAEYWEALSRYGWDAGLLRQLPPAWRGTALPGAEEHQTDTEGAWYSPRCRSDRWAGTPEELTTVAADFDVAHPPVYVEAGEPRPAAVVVPPEMLAQVAYDAMEVPRGRIEWNPKAAGVGATIVGMDTWVWLADTPSAIQVTASIPGVWARVDAVVDGLKIEADGADSVTCGGLGTPWTSEARSTDCAIVFERSSANQSVKAGQTLPTSTMRVSTRWSASWVSSLDATPRPLGDQDVSVTSEVPVAEIQTVVTGSG